jgi:hypothetical protein
MVVIAGCFGWLCLARVIFVFPCPVGFGSCTACHQNTMITGRKTTACGLSVVDDIPQSLRDLAGRCASPHQCSVMPPNTCIRFKLTLDSLLPGGGPGLLDLHGVSEIYHIRRQTECLLLCHALH